ncbi:hypothetical protein SAMN05444143_106108 [Flavobacterium succinicans]|uniref:Uncharacterized protein n=1 Tax=Flavobacterium succinicans TaxID=29536 RepID=A0A1I4WCF0_9FLAO|nr:hypothetical protein SAMN05444143_106108 [Flavobacterium succinicans]
MIYKHTINTSLESNNVNDDDVIESRTFSCVKIYAANIMQTKR